MLIDTHCHLQDPKFDTDRDAVLLQARAAGVSALVVIGYDLDRSRRAVEIAEANADVYATVGVHPHDSRTVTQRDLDQLSILAASPRVVAIGEIGLDFYRDLSPRDVQKTVFLKQLEVARTVQLPVVVHARDADEATFEILAEYAADAPPFLPEGRPLGVLHCFAGNLALAHRYIEMDFVISIAGPCTYPSAEQTHEVAREISLHSMVVETDAPYLPPQSHRGQRNEPAYLAETVQFIADLRGTTFSAVADATAATALRLFALGNPSNPLSDHVLEAH